jgi:hypothetical protein
MIKLNEKNQFKMKKELINYSYYKDICHMLGANMLNLMQEANKKK